ncbi:MAG: outer membrane protein assembly factor BamD [Geobacteraceae bacterium]|nr:outer membrane protein assembly factor BamD [Geobacteraceae bacterium]
MSLRLFLRLYLCLGLLFVAGCATTPPPAAPPEALLQEGENSYAARRYEDAIAQWKRVKEGSAPPELTTRAELRIADAHFANKSYIEAAAAYEDFRKLHPTNEKAPYALYRLGLSHFNQMGGIDTEQTPVKNTVTMFETFLSQYPASEYAAEIRDKLEICRTRQLQYEIYVGRFYLKTGKYQSAIKRLEEALVLFPRSPLHDETLISLGEAYLRSGEKAKGEEIFTRLINEFPASRHAVEARKLQKKL